MEAYDVAGRRLELTIGARRHEVAGVHGAVENAGVGFEQVSIERLFQALYTTKPDGLGMGPSIGRSIILPHGGCLVVTCVTILFLKLAEPTGGLVELLFPRVEAETGRASGKINEDRPSHFPPGPLG